MEEKVQGRVRLGCNFSWCVNFHFKVKLFSNAKWELRHGKVNGTRGENFLKHIKSQVIYCNIALKIITKIASP